MLGNVIEQLENYGNALPRFTAPRCLLERQAVGGCDACMLACPHYAVIFGPLGESVQIDPERCTGCGLCVQSCPTGALEYDVVGPLQLLRDLAEQDEGATLTCSQSGIEAPSLPCLAHVNVALLSAAGAWQKPLELLHGNCETCTLGGREVPLRLEAKREQAQRLREATGQTAHITIRPATPDDTALRQQVSRRGAFRRLFRVGRRQLAHALVQQPLPFVDWNVPEERVPDEWRWRVTTLRPSPSPQTPVHWPAPRIDDTCIDCPVCANVCPTEAIRREINSAGTMTLALQLGACTGCMACLRSCPPQAIFEQPEWYPAAFDALIVLRQSTQ